MGGAEITKGKNKPRTLAPSEGSEIEDDFTIGHLF